MGGHLINQPLPQPSLQYCDPFILIHHMHSIVLPKQRENDVGIGPHPHRGFCPITFVYKGNVVHRDSLGNKQTVEEGGTQWMFAGRGVTHSERHTKELASQGGEIEIIQFWVNVPARLKMTTPQYKAISFDETPVIESETGKIVVVAGSYGGKVGPAPTISPLILLRCSLNRNGSQLYTIPRSHNTVIYLLDGELEINGTTIFNKQIVTMNHDGDSVTIKAVFDTRFIIFSGEPIGEKIEHYGPFVMNNQTEIMEAMRDSQLGRMGILIEEFEPDDYYIE